jgi:hypothetical protein
MEGSGSIQIIQCCGSGMFIPDPGSCFFKELKNFLPKKLSLSSQKYGFGIRDPGSGKNLFRIPDPGVKKAPDPDPQH